MQKHTYDPGGKARRSPDNGEPYLFFCRIIVQIYKKYLPVSNIAPSICLQHTKKTATHQKSSYSIATFNSSKAKLLGFAKKKLYKFR